MATGGTNLYRRLEQLLPGVLGRRYRRLGFEDGSIVPTVADLEVGAAEVIRETMAEVGDAKIISDGAIDLPIVDLSADEDRYKILMIAAAFSFTFQQERAYEKATNFAQMSQRKMMLAQRSIAEKANKMAAFGNAALGITGFLNNPGVTPNNSSFDPYNAVTTPDEMAEFFIGEIGAVVADTNAVEYPDHIGISIDLDFLLMSTRMTDGSMSVKQYILQNTDLISSITSYPDFGFQALEDNGVLAPGTNKDRIVLYPMDQEVVERHIELTKLAPPEYIERKNMRTLYPMFHCVTPTIINYPGAMRYIDVAKKS